jgi:hypothetical protein
MLRKQPVPAFVLLDGGIILLLLLLQFVQLQLVILLRYECNGDPTDINTKCISV